MNRLAIILLASSLQSVIAANFYVAPTASGNGTLNNPGSLATAMAHTGWAASIAPGDTVYLRAGTYGYGIAIMHMQFSGSSGHLVTWRNYPGERAVINFPIRFQTSDYHRFRGLEFYDSNRQLRPDSLGCFDSSTGKNYEWINCIIHDTTAVWTGGSAGQSVRGCIIWYAGKTYRDHVMYPYCKDFSGNLIGWNAAQVVQLGTPGIMVRSNIIFGTGVPVFNNQKSSILITDGDGGVVSDNRLFDTVVRGGGILVQGITAYTALGVSNNIVAANATPITIQSGFSNINVIGNTSFDLSIGGTGYPLKRTVSTGNWTVNGNSYYAINSLRFIDVGDAIKDFATWKADNAGYDTASTASTGYPPDSVTVFPNADEPKRAHIAIYNWTKAHNVMVHVSGVLVAGDNYSLYSAQNFLAGPIKTGTISGATISVPMTNLTVAPILYALNLTWPNSTSPEFGAFVLVGGNTNMPPPAPVLHVGPRR